MKLLFIFLCCSSILNCIDQNDKIDINYQNWYQEDLTPKKIAFDWKYVVSKYEQTIEGRKCVFYPAKNPKRLIISFAYALRGFYAMWSFFWRDTEDWNDTAYLFVRDDNLTWYVGTRKAPPFSTFKNIIDHFLKITDLTYDNCFAIGSSAGGYGALLFSATLGFKGAIVEIPTFDRELWNKAVHWQQIKQDFAWIDLEILLKKTIKLPHISIQYGKCPADVACCNKMIEVLKAINCPFTVYHTSSPDHNAIMDQAFFEKEIAYIESQVDLNALVPAQYCS